MKTPIVACLQTRLEHYARRKRRNRGKFSHPQQKHHFIKREIDSMNDCFEFMEEPLYGFRVKVTQEIECSKLGPNCGMPSNSTDKGGLILESFSIGLQFQNKEIEIIHISVKKVLHHFPEHLYFRWIVIRISG